MDIREDIKHYQDTLSYASSKVDYSVGQNIYILPSDMNLKIRTGTARYNNKILVSDEKFSLGKNVKVNLTAPAIKSHKYSKTNSLEPTTIVSHSTTTQRLGPETLPHGAHAPTGPMKMKKLPWFVLWLEYLRYDGTCFDD